MGIVQDTFKTSRLQCIIQVIQVVLHKCKSLERDNPTQLIVKGTFSVTPILTQQDLLAYHHSTRKSPYPTFSPVLLLPPYLSTVQVQQTPSHQENLSPIPA